MGAWARLGSGHAAVSMVCTVRPRLSEQLGDLKVRSDCGTFGLLIILNRKWQKRVSRKCVRIVRYTDKRSTD